MSTNGLERILEQLLVTLGLKRRSDDMALPRFLSSEADFLWHE